MIASRWPDVVHPSMHLAFSSRVVGSQFVIAVWHHNQVSTADHWPGAKHAMHLADSNKADGSHETGMTTHSAVATILSMLDSISRMGSLRSSFL